MPCDTRRPISARRPRRGGSVMVYTLVSVVALMGVTSLAVDYGHVQSIRAQMQRSADAAARGWLDLVIVAHNPPATATLYTTYLAQSAYNPIDGPNGAACTVSITPGTWDSTTNTFSPNAGSTSAVQVKISRTAAAGNGVPLFWGKLLGRATCDVHASAIGAVVGGQSGNVSVPSTANPYLAGMPPGTHAGQYNDTTANAGSYQMACVPVVPGTYITLTNLGGQTSILPGYVNNYGPAGEPDRILHHGQNYDSNPNPPYPNTEHGIGDAKMPADAMMGVFLTNNAPDTANAPPAVDWTDAAHANQATYSNIVPQEPFLIGNGQTTGGTTQQFLVPAGATRLYLGIWDGTEYSNNGGTLTGTIGVQQKVMLVQAQ